MTVNGKFPGPRIVAREGDRVLVRVVNHVPNNISIHWYERHNSLILGIIAFLFGLNCLNFTMLVYTFEVFLILSYPS